MKRFCKKLLIVVLNFSIFWGNNPLVTRAANKEVTLGNSTIEYGNGSYTNLGVY